MLALLSALHSDKLRGKQENFFNQVIASESFDHFSSQISYLLATLHLSDQVPPFFRGALAQQTSKNLVRNLILKAQLRKLPQSFESLGIDTIVHDGPYLTEKYYNDLTARYTENVLFFVGSKQRDWALTVIQAGWLYPSKKHPTSSRH